VHTPQPSQWHLVSSTRSTPCAADYMWKYDMSVCLKPGPWHYHPECCEHCQLTSGKAVLLAQQPLRHRVHTAAAPAVEHYKSEATRQILQMPPAEWPPGQLPLRHSDRQQPMQSLSLSLSLSLSFASSRAPNRRQQLRTPWLGCGAQGPRWACIPGPCHPHPMRPPAQCATHVCTVVGLQPTADTPQTAGCLVLHVVRHCICQIVHEPL
jgi:hypothetical protein